MFKDIKVYARPEIEPFPVVKSWTLVAEGKYDILNDKLIFYSFDEKLEEILQLVD